METKALVYRSWDDLVFAYRNKTYGAYMLRRAYARRLILAVGVSTTMIAVLLLVPEIISRFKGESQVGPVIIPEPLTINLTTRPEIIPVEMPRPKASATPVTTARTNTTIRVVTEPVEPPAPEESTVSFPSEGEIGEGGVPDGVGMAPIDIPVVVEDKNKIWDIVEEPPVYDGGMEGIIKFIKKKMRYPGSARRQGIQGTVYVSFVVNGDGSISHVTVLRGIHMDCDEEARRVISLLPSWKGGKQNGRPVPVRMVLPLKFSLQ